MKNGQGATGARPSSDRRVYGKVRAWLVVAVSLAAVGCPIAAVAVYYGVFCPGNWHVVAAGKLHRSAQPAPRQFWNFSHRGYKRVVSLRAYTRMPELLEQQRAACEAAGTEFIHIPITARLPSHEQIDRFLEAVETSPGPVLVHCQHGKSRAGMMSAAHRVMVQGWEVERAMKDEFVRRFPTVDDDARALVADLIRGYAEAKGKLPPATVPAGR